MSDLFQQGEQSNEAGLSPGTILGRAVGTNVGYVQNLSGSQVAAIIAADTPDAIAANTVADADLIPFYAANGASQTITGNNFFTETTNKMASVTTKVTLADADSVVIVDNSAGVTKRTLWSDLKTNIQTALGALITGSTSKATVIDADEVVLSDSAASSATKKVSFTNLWLNYFKGKADALYQPLSTILTSITSLGNGTGFLQNNGSGTLSWGTVSVDPWAYQPIGVPIPLKDNITGVSGPSNGSSYTYVKLTAGLTGVGSFNNGLLTSESVSGSSPTVTATAVVSVSGSPINGQTIRLLNTEERFLRASTSAGTLQDSALGAHTHTGTTGTESADHTHSGTTGTVSSDHTHSYLAPAGGYSSQVNLGYYTSAGGASTGGISANHTHSFTSGGRSATHTHSFTSDSTGTTETRGRNLGVTYYMRVK